MNVEKGGLAQPLWQNLLSALLGVYSLVLYAAAHSSRFLPLGSGDLDGEREPRLQMGDG